ncbi:MAG: restriction endonuclease subunit S [Proteobacteria bacterium]|nr:restriction endonuclease subunit S [Pseudomonadota bacterium]
MTNNLPENWTKSTLEEVSTIIMGQSPLSEYYNTEGDGLPFFQGKAEFGDFYPEAVKWCSKPGKIAGKDDILISVRAPVGPTNLAPSECCIGRGLAAIRPNGDIPNKYLLYYLRSIENEIDSYGTGTTFRAISGKILKSLSVPIAPLEQQKRIVAEIEKQFSRLDEAVANLRRVKANLKRYKAAVLKAAVEGKLTEEWRKQHPDVEPASKLLERILAERRQKWEEAELAKMKAKGKAPEDDKWKNKYKEPECFGHVDFTIPKSWMVATVQQLAERVQYGSSSKTKEDTDGIPVLRMGNIFEGELSLEKLKYLPQKHNEFPELFLKDDDLLFNRTNSPELVGKTAVYKGKPSPCSFASYLIRVQLMPGVEAKFLSYYINSMHGRQWVKSVVTQQVGQANVNGTKLQALIIPVPPAMEQKTIVSEMENRFSLMNGMEVAVETNMLRAERLRQSILSKAFTGQLIELIALGEE